MNEMNMKRKQIKTVIFAAFFCVLGIIVLLSWFIRVRNDSSSLPQEMPRAAMMSRDQLQEARNEYRDSLRDAEKEAFDQGYLMTVAKTETWGSSTEVNINLGESGYAVENNFSGREMEAFAMGLHFAQEEAKIDVEEQGGR